MSASLDLGHRVDLLRERRQELNLPDPRLVQQQQRRDLLKGGLWAVGLVGVIGALGVALLMRQQWVSVELDRVAVVEAQVASLERDLTSSRQQLLQLRTGNKTLAEALAATPSGAALMRELQLRVPEGIQLTSLKKSAGNTLSLEGLAQGPGSFVRINALLLELGQSALIREPKLVKAARNPADAKEATAAGLVAFEISATLADLAATPDLEATLRSLGAEGQVKRLQLLRREGLLP
jgi:type IV pilus assembly protein PilN